eukprot:725103-Pelagomonas_calceolata.AAC.2
MRLCLLGQSAATAPSRLCAGGAGVKKGISCRQKLVPGVPFMPARKESTSSFPARIAQAAEYWQLAFLALLAIVQGAVVWVGMSAGVIICVK